MDDDDRTPVPEGYDAEQWRKADEVHHAMALVADDAECVKILYAALSPSPQPRLTLDELIAKSKADLAAMSEEERRAMWAAQRESFARGMSTPCEHGVLDFEQCPDCRNPSPQPQEVACCPICDEPFQPTDLCAYDITEGTCHAACLEGSPVVDMETEEEIPGGQATTYLYREVMEPADRAATEGSVDE